MISSNFGAHLSQPCLKKCSKCFCSLVNLFSLISFIQLSPFSCNCYKSRKQQESETSPALTNPYICNTFMYITVTEYIIHTVWSVNDRLSGYLRKTAADGFGNGSGRFPDFLKDFFLQFFLK